MLEQRVSESLALIANAKRPVVLVGGGVKLGRAVVEARRTAELLGFPVVVSWSGFDAFPHKHPLFVGQMGVYGNRGANFAVQNADLLLSLGSRLDTRQTGGAPKTFARAAKKIVVDIDTGELHKNRGLNADVAVCANVKDYLTLLTRRLSGVKKVDISPWLEKTRIWRTKYPICLPEYHTEKGAVNAYVFMQELSRVLKPDAVVVTDCGGNLTWTMQAFELKEGQRLFSAMGNSPMGYALPAAIGASIALGKKPVVCIIGDGGLQMNIQELQTIVAYNLPIKIFVMNNHCYGIIKQFQEMYFESRYEATGRGYTVPDFVAIAQAYHMATESIHDHSDALQEKILRALNAPGAMLCDVNIREDQKLVPKLEFGKPIEDLSPLLAREEFLDNMLIKPVSDS